MSPRAADQDSSSVRVLPFRPAVSHYGPQELWKSRTVGERLEVVRRFRHSIAEHSDQLVDAVHLPQRGSRAETLAAEILPLADACLFLERKAEEILAPNRLGSRGRPFWLRGSDVEIRREPLGIVLIIGPSNYPLLLPGVQLLQALTAGNAVELKPGAGGSEAASLMLSLLRQAGLPGGLVTLLDEEPAAAASAIERGVDKVVLTGSVSTGIAVASKLAESLTPAVMELSGCDAVIVRDDADIGMVGRALRFGLTFNSSFTCIAPRRVLIHQSRHSEVEEQLIALLSDAPALPVDATAAVELQRLVARALDQGARFVCGSLPQGTAATTMRPLVLAGVTAAMDIVDADLAAPVLSLLTFDDDRQALDIVKQSRFALGATIFGNPEKAHMLADEVPAGVVVINDLIVPTADPRLPFGGRGASGYGVTRGAEGLLELTRPKTIIRRHGRFRPHFEPTGPHHESLFRQFVRVAHARTFWQRLRAALHIIKLFVQSRPKRG